MKVELFINLPVEQVSKQSSSQNIAITHGNVYRNKCEVSVDLILTITLQISCFFFLMRPVFEIFTSVFGSFWQYFKQFRKNGESIHVL